MMWKHIDTGVKSAVANMELDAKLLENLDPKGPGLLHLYDWQKPCFTYGYFIKPDQLVDLNACKELGIDCARRPTGGGIVFHITDYAFSVLVPAHHEGYNDNVLDNYHYVNEKVKEAMKNICSDSHLLPYEIKKEDVASSKFCMAKPTIYDVMLGSKKIAGSAQRKRKQGYLHQGSITLGLPDLSVLHKILLSSENIVQLMQENTFNLLGSDLGSLEQIKSNIKKQLIKVFS